MASIYDNGNQLALVDEHGNYTTGQWVTPSGFQAWGQTAQVVYNAGEPSILWTGNSWSSANNTFVRNAEGAISLIYNGSLCGISAPLYQALGQALGSPPGYVQLTDAQYNAIPTGPQVSSFAAVNGGAQVFVLVTNGDLIFWNAGSWSDSSLGPVTSFAVVGNGNQVFALQQNGDLSFFNAGSWSTGVHNVAWFAPANGGANVLAGQTDGSLIYYIVSTNTWGTANNTLVENAEGAISLIYNGSLCGISNPLYQALGHPGYAQLSDAQYNSIPVGVQVSSFPRSTAAPTCWCC